MADETGGAGGPREGLANARREVGFDDQLTETLTRSDKIMLLRVIRRAKQADFDISELRGWAWTHVARVLADPKTPRRLRLRGAGLIVDRSDPVKQAVAVTHDRPVAVQVNVIQPADGSGSNPRSELSPGGLQIHLDGGNGSG